MYEADGIDLTKSEYEHLRRLEKAGGRNDDAILSAARSDTYLRDVYKSLQKKGLVYIMRDRLNLASAVFLEPAGRDWIASYEYSVQKERESFARNRENAIAGAVAGGIVSFVVSIVTHMLFQSS